MSKSFERPKGIKYTDMAIYVDTHMPDVIVPYKNEEIESKIVEYLYDIIYALAKKSDMFRRYDDYDSFACYGATEIFLSMRKKLVEEAQGKLVKGKPVVKVKSSLNFIKAVLLPLKINYQRDTFGTVYDPEFCDTSRLDALMKENIQQNYTSKFEEAYNDTITELPMYVDRLVNKSPFRNDKLMCKRLRISILLTLLDELTLPNAAKNKLTRKLETKNPKNIMKQYTNAYKKNNNPALQWHLEENFDSYVYMLMTRVKAQFSNTLNSNIHDDELADDLLDGILRSAYAKYNGRDEDD